MKLDLFINIIFIFSLINISYEYIVIPFKNINTKSPSSYNFNSITGEQFLEFSTNKLISSISLGVPPKSLELYLTMDYKLFFIGKGYCYKDAKSFYEPIKSSSYSYNDTIYKVPFNDLRNMTIGKEKCSLYNDYYLRSNISLDKMQIYYGNIAEYAENIFDKNKICGIMGFKLHNFASYKDKFVGLETVLKRSGIDNSSFWTIEFFDENKKKQLGNNYDGYIVLGAGDNKYLKDIRNITEDDIQNSYNSYSTGSQEWMLKFQPIYFYDAENNTIKMDYVFSDVAFNFDIKYYFGTKEYFDNIKKYFFNDYIEKGICHIKTLNEFYLKYKYIICNKYTFAKEKKNFPKLYLKSPSFNYTFELSHEDLFIEVNNIFLFLMFYDPWNPRNFKFGQNFLVKYNFIFQIEQKGIGFINYKTKNETEKEKEKKEEEQSNENKDKTKIILIIVFSVLFVGIIIGIFVGKKLWDKNKKKKRANELVDDDYEYESKKEAINEN